jgi:hypothetical protein
MYKVITELSVELSSLSYIKTLLNSIMLVISYHTENLARLGGVRSSVGCAARWWNTLLLPRLRIKGHCQAQVPSENTTPTADNFV